MSFASAGITYHYYVLPFRNEVTTGKLIDKWFCHVLKFGAIKFINSFQVRKICSFDSPMMSALLPCIKLNFENCYKEIVIALIGIQLTNNIRIPVESGQSKLPCIMLNNLFICIYH